MIINSFLTRCLNLKIKLSLKCIYRTHSNIELNIILDFSCPLEDFEAYASWIWNFVYTSPYTHVYYFYTRTYIYAHIYMP